MRTILLSILLLGSVEVLAQALSIRLEKQSLPFAIGVQSFAVASYDQYLLIVGGRTEGLHKRRPFESFANAGSNRELILFDRSKLQSVHFDVNILDYPYRDQFQSTNMAFWQDGDRLILAGGYGYGPVTGRHTTYPFLSVIDIPCLIDKLLRGDIPGACMRSIEDPRMAITGGQLARLDDGRYYLVGGQYFDGLYNPMGPTHGPGFTQAYSNEIRRFFLRENADSLYIEDYEVWHDELNLHRRDYNLSLVKKPSGGLALIAFSGVFRHMEDLPFLNAVVIDSSGYRVDNDFVQRFSHYHSARVSLFDKRSNAAMVVFLGGLAQFRPGPGGSIVEDTEVPFVNTISAVSYDDSQRLTEWLLPDTMPGLLGTGAEFVPNSTLTDTNGIIDISDWADHREYLLGYMIGGIRSTTPNSFFLDGDYTDANPDIYAVYGKKTSTAVRQAHSPDNSLKIKAWPVPANRELHVEIEVPQAGPVYFYLLNDQGVIVHDWQSRATVPGRQNTSLSLPRLPTGQYWLSVGDRQYLRQIPVQIAGN